MRLNRLIAIPALLIAGIALSAATPTTSFQCGNTKEFKLGPDGGTFTLDHARVVAPKGALNKETTFTIRMCPGTLGNEELSKVLPAFEKTATGERGKKITDEKLFASNTYPSVEIKSKGTLDVTEGKWLHYCLVGSDKDPANKNVIFHNEKTAPVALDHTPTTNEHCVRFRTLSFFHHFTHWVKHTANNVGHEAKKDAGKVGHVAKQVGNDIKNLFDPCHLCKKAVSRGTSPFSCSGGTSKMLSQYEKCNAKVDEVEPELAEYSPAICGAIEASFKLDCKFDKKSPLKKMSSSKFSQEVCHKAHLCG